MSSSRVGHPNCVGSTAQVGLDGGLEPRDGVDRVLRLLGYPLQCFGQDRVIQRSQLDQGHVREISEIGHDVCRVGHRSSSMRTKVNWVLC
jgi:hypothetical protein